MVDLYNSTGIIGSIIQNTTYNATGSIFLTLSIIVIGLIIIGMMFRLSFELIIIIILPILLVVTAFYGEFWAFTGTLLILLGILLSKIFFFNK